MQNFRQDVGIMMGNQKLFGFGWITWSKYFTVCWAFVSPVFLCVSNRGFTIQFICVALSIPFCKLHDFIFLNFQSIAAWSFFQTPVSSLSYGEYVYPSWAGPLGLFVAIATILGKHFIINIAWVWIKVRET